MPLKLYFGGPTNVYHYFSSNYIWMLLFLIIFSFSVRTWNFEQFKVTKYSFLIFYIICSFLASVCQNFFLQWLDFLILMDHRLRVISVKIWSIISVPIFKSFSSSSFVLELQARTEYLRKTLVFMWNSTLWEKFNFYFQGVFR